MKKPSRLSGTALYKYFGFSVLGHNAHHLRGARRRGYTHHDRGTRHGIHHHLCNNHRACISSHDASPIHYLHNRKRDSHNHKNVVQQRMS